jgi:hypothetical protein
MDEARATVGNRSVGQRKKSDTQIQSQLEEIIV